MIHNWRTGLILMLLPGVVLGQPATGSASLPKEDGGRPGAAFFERALVPILDEAATKGTLLPPDVRQRVSKWQTRLAGTRVLQVTCDLEQDWRYLDDLDANGSPKVHQHERYEAQAWMTATSSWLVVFPCETGPDGREVPNYATPHLQQLWREGTIWERVWKPETQEYRVLKYPATFAHGPETSGLDAKGCVYGTVLGSWLADGGSIAETPALKRHPRPAVSAPHECPDGSVWLLGFDTYTSPAKGPVVKAYVDYMLLSRDDEMVSWYTRGVSHERDRPQDIIAERRLKYGFFETIPEDVAKAMSEFASIVEAGLAPAADEQP